MTREELQDGADWLYRQFYRLDRCVLRVLKTLFVAGPVPAYLAWKLNKTYRYDNRRESIIGRNTARSYRKKVPHGRISIPTASEAKSQGLFSA